MAEVNNQNNLNATKRKIYCRSRGSGSRLVGQIQNCVINSVLEKIPNKDGQTKAKIEEKFNEVFSTVFKQNITVDGEDWDHPEGSHCKDEDISTEELQALEFEPFDQEKKKYFTRGLMEEMEEATLKMALNRQHISYAYSRKLKQLAMSDIQYLGHCSVDIPESRFLDLPHAKTDYETTEEFSRKLQESTQSIQHLIKQSSVMCKKLENIQLSRKMLESSKTSEADNVIYNKSEPDRQSNSLKRKLVFDLKTTKRRKR